MEVVSSSLITCFSHSAKGSVSEDEEEKELKALQASMSMAM